MPEINFVLPHWLYWSGLVIFPLLAMIIFRRTYPGKKKEAISLPLCYFLLFTGGFIGVHRLYLKSAWTLLFIALFGTVLVVNIEVREARDTLSAANNDIKLAELKIQRAEKAVKKGRRNAEQKLAKARQQLEETRPVLKAAQENSDYWNTSSNILGVVILILLIIDAFLIPKLARQRNAIESPPEPDTGFHCPTAEAEHDDSREPYKFNRITSHINGLAGEFVAYWSVIAVFVYYYEVIARYVFNSPTNWAHESMFLMFGIN